MAPPAGWQRVVLVTVLIGYLAVLTLSAAMFLSSLSDDTVKQFANWIEAHWAEISGTITAAVLAVVSFLFGQRRGEGSGETAAFAASMGAAANAPSSAEAVKLIRQQANARGHQVGM